MRASPPCQVEVAAIQPQAAQQPFSIFNELELRFFQRRVKGKAFGKAGESIAPAQRRVPAAMRAPGARNAALFYGAAYAKLPQGTEFIFLLCFPSVRTGAVADAENATVDREGGERLILCPPAIKTSAGRVRRNAWIPQ